MPTKKMYETERLIARHLSTDDYDIFFQAYSDKGAMRYVDDGEPITPEDCRGWLDITLKNYDKRGYGMSALVLKESGAVVGFMGLVHPGGQEEAEIKYTLLRDYWGQGLATEAAQGMIAYGQQQLALPKIIATVHPDHKPSQNVLRKAGMAHVEDVSNDDGSVTMVFATSPTPPAPANDAAAESAGNG